jgi:hypothetical protein
VRVAAQPSSEAELYAKLAAAHPEAQAALTREGNPMAVTVPKRTVEALAGRGDVAFLYLAEGQEQLLLDTPVPAN